MHIPQKVTNLAAGVLAWLGVTGCATHGSFERASFPTRTDPQGYNIPVHYKSLDDLSPADRKQYDHLQKLYRKAVLEQGYDEGTLSRRAFNTAANAIGPKKVSGKQVGAVFEARSNAKFTKGSALDAQDDLFRFEQYHRLFPTVTKPPQ